jgi:glycosyltransferase involved in cell wall biosynthesis
MPKISILMPVYNTEEFLEESICSVLEQTFTDFEFLILDDASSDGSLKIIQKYATQDKRIKLFEARKNLGFTKSRNFLLNKISGEYIAWLDSDDLFSKNKLQEQINFLSNNSDIQVLGTWGKKIFQGAISHIFPTPTGSYNIHCNFVFWNGIIQSSSIFHHSLVTEKKIKYNENFSSAEDYQFWLEAAQLVKFENIAKPLTFYRVHSAQESSKNSQRQIECHLKMVKANLERISISCELLALSQFLFLTPKYKKEYKNDIFELVEKIIRAFQHKNGRSKYFETKILRQYYKYLRVFFPHNYKKLFIKDFGWRGICAVKFFPTMERKRFY